MNLTMTSQRTNHLNDSWCSNLYWPPDGAVEHCVKSFEASTQFVVKASLLQKLRSVHPYQQPFHVQSHLNPFLPHSDARFELQQVVFTSRCLNALSCCHVISWLAIYVTKQLTRCRPNKVAGECIYTATQKFGISKILNVFKGVSSAHQGCIYLIKIQKKTVILWNPIAISNIGFLI